MFVCTECGAPQPRPGLCPTDNLPLAPIGDDLLLGQTIGAYRVARLLGIGGMGRVYKGVHPSIGSRVAIKVLSRECTDRRDLVERFFAEAKAVNLIRHESIVNVLDLAMLPDGRPFIIMEYLDGAPLAALLEESIANRAPLPLGGLARLAVEVLDALGAAHGKNIVHRDLKPDNIFVAPSGRPKVLDFGIAKLSDGGVGSATRTGSLLGTPHYMSPEQAAGKPVDHRADIYAMGVILYECVTGTKLFQAESLFELLRKQVEEPAPSPRLIRADLSPELEAVILTALAKAPDQRFATAQAMSIALQHATAQLPPEQWVPISGSGAHKSTTGSIPPRAWQPTPPQSWGGGASPSQAVPRPSEPAAFQQKHSTVSASSGQVQQQAKRSGGKGLWLGLAAVAVIGGGITAAVIATNGGGDDTSAAKADPPPPEDKKGDDAKEEKKVASDDRKDDRKDDKKAEKADDPKADKKAATTPSTEKKAAHHESDADADADSDDDPMKGLPKDVQAELEAIVKDAPPEVRAQMKQLEELAKLPPAERAAKVQELQRKLLEEALKTGITNIPSPPKTGSSGGGGKTPPTPSVTTDPGGAPPVSPPSPGGWITSRPLAPPPGWDPKRADPGAFIAYALAEARKAVPDAVLTRVEVDGVSPDGRADLTLRTLASDHGSIELRFISPSHMKRDPKVPVGVPVEWKCQFRIEAEPGGVTLRPINGFDCAKEQPIANPRCTPAALWKRALATRKPPTNAVATMSYYGWRGAPARWHFSIGFGMDVSFSETFDDGC
ncbi:MAG: protein kinase [Deltaproteobacteria bacterium]|nr:protein kinase [Deltaproteobacteria bacterium]